MWDGKLTVNCPIFEMLSKTSVGTLMAAVYQYLPDSPALQYQYVFLRLRAFTFTFWNSAISLGALFLSFAKCLSDLDFNNKTAGKNLAWDT